jgi:hypothetical protein
MAIPMHARWLNEGRNENIRGAVDLRLLGEGHILHDQNALLAGRAELLCLLRVLAARPGDHEPYRVVPREQLRCSLQEHVDAHLFDKRPMNSTTISSGRIPFSARKRARNSLGDDILPSPRRNTRARSGG